jgi:hypothetical protein
MGYRPPTRIPIAIEIIKKSRLEPAEFKMIYEEDLPSPTQSSTTTPPDGLPQLTPAAPGPALPADPADSPAAPLATSEAPLAFSAPSDPSLPPDFDRHARRCSICSHPDRDAIEGEFIRWASPRRLAKDYQIADRASLYRHAHATGLFPRRRREFARVLEDILECVEHSSLEESADVMIRAARVYAHLDEKGMWFEPPRTHIIFTGPAPSQFTGNPEITASAEPQPNEQPGRIPLKLARKLNRGSKAKKRLIATQPNSKKRPTP